MSRRSVETAESPAADPTPGFEPARQLRGPVRPAAEPDRGHARHHRGLALAGDRRLHRVREGRREGGTSSRPRRSCSWPPPSWTSRPRGCCRRATSRTRRTWPCWRRATCCSPGCCSTARSSRSPPLDNRLAGESLRHARSVGLEERFASLLPEVLIGIGLEQFAALAAKAMEPAGDRGVAAAHPRQQGQRSGAASWWSGCGAARGP